MKKYLEKCLWKHAGINGKFLICGFPDGIRVVFDDKCECGHFASKHYEEGAGNCSMCPCKKHIEVKWLT